MSSHWPPDHITFLLSVLMTDVPLNVPSPLQGLHLPPVECIRTHIVVVPQTVRTFQLLKLAPKLLSLCPIVAKYRLNLIYAQVELHGGSSSQQL